MARPGIEPESTLSVADVPGMKYVSIASATQKKKKYKLQQAIYSARSPWPTINF